MKRYNKPILDIVEFDNLDVIMASHQSLTEEDDPVAIKNEEILTATPTEAPLDHASVTETPAPADEAPLADTTTPESTPADENTADEQPDDSTADPADDGETAAQSVSEDEVE